MGVVLRMLAAIGMVTGGILASAFSKILADEFKAWNPRLTRSLLQYAVDKLPKAYQDRYLEEWTSHLADIPGELFKLRAALGFLIAARVLRNSQRQSRFATNIFFRVMATDDIVLDFRVHSLRSVTVVLRYPRENHDIIQIRLNAWEGMLLHAAILQRRIFGSRTDRILSGSIMLLAKLAIRNTVPRPK